VTSYNLNSSQLPSSNLRLQSTSSLLNSSTGLGNSSSNGNNSRPAPIITAGNTTRFSTTTAIINTPSGGSRRPDSTRVKPPNLFRKLTNAVPPPSTSELKRQGAGQDDLLPISLSVGDAQFVLDSVTGRWSSGGLSASVASSELVSAQQQQISALLDQVRMLEEKLLAKAKSSQSSYETEKKLIEMERNNLMLQEENQQIKFKNKLLLAMCAIAEGDYKQLCKEAGVEAITPQDRLKRAAGMGQTAGVATVGVGINRT